jgi:hypothetical protein
VQKLKSRIDRLEKQLAPVPSACFIVAFSDREAEQKIRDFQHQNPGQPSPSVIIVEFVSPGDLIKDDLNSIENK